MLPNAVYTVAAFLLAGGFVLLYSMKNKKLKRGITLTLICTVIIYMIVQCSPKASERPFRQPVENIASATIRNGDIYDQKEEEYAVVQELSPYDTVALIDTLQGLELDFVYFNHYLDFHGLFLEIHYHDGEIEQIGQHNNFWFATDETYHYGGYAFEDGERFARVLTDYCTTR